MSQIGGNQGDMVVMEMDKEYYTVGDVTLLSATMHNILILVTYLNSKFNQIMRLN